MNVAAATACLLIDPRDRILLTVRASNPGKGKLDLPGGFIDAGESVEDGLRREIFEELNVTPDQLSYLGSFPNRYHYRDVLYHTVDMIFYSRLSADQMKELKPLDDIDAFKLIAADELPWESIAFGSMKQAIRCFLNRLS